MINLEENQLMSSIMLFGSGDDATNAPEVNADTE